jgi:enoyl-CoA hydratase
VGVKVEPNGPVTTVVIDRPRVKNAVDPDTARALKQAFMEFNADDAARAAVLWGAGGCFCAGFDLASAAGEGLDDLLDRYDPQGDGPMGPTRLELDKPVIAAVEGHAVAGGLELALWCDLRVAAQDAVFGVSCRRWGVPLIDGGTVRLPRLIGQGRAMDMILTGRPIIAGQALDWGLVDRVAPPGQARAQAEALAAEIARFPQICLRADRRSARGQWGLPLAEALVNEARGGLAPLRQETRAGAGRFVGGQGRGGSLDEI